MSYKCLQCSAYYWSKSELKSQVKIYHYEQYFEWKTCHEQFCREENILRHRKTTHEVSKFCCGDCGENFNRKDNLQRHTLAVHKESEEFRCNLCDSTFNLKNNFERHQKAAYTMDESPRHKGGDCIKMFCTGKCGNKFTLQSFRHFFAQSFFGGQIRFNPKFLFPR